MLVSPTRSGRPVRCFTPVEEPINGRHQSHQIWRCFFRLTQTCCSYRGRGHLIYRIEPQRSETGQCWQFRQLCHYVCHRITNWVFLTCLTSTFRVPSRLSLLRNWREREQTRIVRNHRLDWRVFLQVGLSRVCCSNAPGAVSILRNTTEPTSITTAVRSAVLQTRGLAFCSFGCSQSTSWENLRRAIPVSRPLLGAFWNSLAAA